MQNEDHRTWERPKVFYKKSSTGIRRQNQSPKHQAIPWWMAFEETKEKASQNVKIETNRITGERQRLRNKSSKFEKWVNSYGDKVLVGQFQITFFKRRSVSNIWAKWSWKNYFLVWSRGNCSGFWKVAIGQTNCFRNITDRRKSSFDESKRLIDIVKEVAESGDTWQGTDLSRQPIFNSVCFPAKSSSNTPIEKLERWWAPSSSIVDWFLIKITNFSDSRWTNRWFGFLWLWIRWRNFWNSNLPGCLLSFPNDRYFNGSAGEHLFCIRRRRRDFWFSW